MGNCCGCCSEKESEEDIARRKEAQLKAGLAAQQRAEAFQKSATGKAAAKVAAAGAKASSGPVKRGNEPSLQWRVG